MIDPDTRIEVMTRDEFADRSAYRLPLQLLDLRRVEGRLDILVLRLRPQGGKDDYLYEVSRRLLVEWMKNQIDELEATEA